ncbi:6803_t:CDS:2, partial [Diversispora eburnea]
ELASEINEKDSEVDNESTDEEISDSIDIDDLEEVPVMMGDSLAKAKLNIEKLSPKQKNKFDELINKNKDLFANDIRIALGKLKDTMNWDEYIPAVLFAYRTHKHNIT